MKPNFKPGDPCYNDKPASEYSVTALPDKLRGLKLFQIVTAQVRMPCHAMHALGGWPCFFHDFFFAYKAGVTVCFLSPKIRTKSKSHGIETARTNRQQPDSTRLDSTRPDRIDAG